MAIENHDVSDRLRLGFQFFKVTIVATLQPSFRADHEFLLEPDIASVSRTVLLLGRSVRVPVRQWLMCGSQRECGGHTNVCEGHREEEHDIKGAQP